MAKLRDDLVGVVHIGGGVYAAGDEVPDGAVVSGGLLAPEPVAQPVTKAPARRRAKAKGGADVGDS